MAEAKSPEEGQPEAPRLSPQHLQRLLKDRTAELTLTNRIADIFLTAQDEETARASHRFLEIANRHMNAPSLLKKFVANLREFSGCSAVGIRLLDDEGNIPYQAYEGFSREFYELESPLQIQSDTCMCTNVIRGQADPGLPFYTQGGSFYMNGTTHFLATVSEGEKGQTRNACNEFGYESMALIPIRMGQRVLGLIHVADARENVVPLKLVQRLEAIAAQLGSSLERVRAEEEVANLSRFPSENPHPVLRAGADGTVLYANAAAEPLLDSLGSGVGKILPHEWNELNANALDGNSTRQTDIQHGGRTFSFEVVPVNEADYVNWYGRDVTKRRHAEKSLRESEDRFHIALSGSKITVFTQDRDLRYTWVYNPHPSLSPETAVGKTDADLLPPEDAAVLTDIKRRVLETGVGERATIRFSVGVEPSFYDIEIEPLYDDAGKIDGLIAASTDITERKRAEEERRKLEEKMQQAQKLESLGVLAGGIAHDFNNLLMGVLSVADQASHELPSTSPVHQHLEMIQKSAHRAASLCRQMLAYSGKGRFAVQTFSLDKLVEDMVELLDVSLSKGVVLKRNYARNVPPIEADVNQMRQVVMNLVTNAAEAIADNSGIVRVSTGVMEADKDYLSSAFLDDDLPQGSYVYVEVADTGCGMDRETMGKIFDPFFTTKFTGRGLGLASVLGIVRGHCGTLKVNSRPGHGTTIRVLLPASEKPAEPLDVKSSKADQCQGEGTILLIDDEEVLREALKLLFSGSGFTLLTARDGIEGVEVFRRHTDEVVAVLLDMTMPRMNGKETFQQLRRIRPDVKVILISGYAEEEAKSRFDSEGLFGFLQKPFVRAQLMATLGEALDAT